MILEQHYLACLSQASYFIFDERTKVAAVVDPRRDVGVYLERAEALGARIEHVILTHFHADFLAGHIELVERTGATIYLGAKAQADYDFTSLADGDSLRFGDVELRALTTPGHTPEGICILVFDHTRSADEPHAVLTGDTLFIGDVGRPDLVASKGVTAEELASALYDSLHDKLLKLPDATVLYPGHGAGSACGKNMSSDTVSTIGAQRTLNYALQPMEKDAFVRLLAADQPPAPAYFPVAADLNRARRATLDDVLNAGLAPLDPAAVIAARNEGAQLLDVRHKDAFAAAHLRGSISIGLDGRYASWAGTLLDLARPVVLIAEPGTEREAALRLGRIGIDKVIGFLDGGAGTFEQVPDEVASVARVTPREAAGELAAGDSPLVVDVRLPGEHESAHVEGSVPMPLATLPAHAAGLPRDRRLLVHCKSGYRSMTAVSLLARMGFEHLVDVEGGIDAWIADGLPTAAGAGTGSCAL